MAPNLLSSVVLVRSTTQLTHPRRPTVEADALTPRALFDGTICYEVPLFQRPYVWTEEDQWQPLWDRVVLSAIEMQRRTETHEEVSLLERLELEHVMPRGWRTYWGADIRGDPERSAQRDTLVDTLGNLTLVTKKEAQWHPLPSR